MSSRSTATDVGGSCVAAPLEETAAIAAVTATDRAINARRCRNVISRGLVTRLDEAAARRPLDTPRQPIRGAADRPDINQHFFILGANRRDDLLRNPARLLRLVGFDIDDESAPRR